MIIKDVLGGENFEYDSKEENDPTQNKTNPPKDGSVKPTNGNKGGEICTSVRLSKMQEGTVMELSEYCINLAKIIFKACQLLRRSAGRGIQI